MIFLKKFNEELNGYGESPESILRDLCWDLVDAGLTIEFPVGKENKFNKFYLSINDKDSVICKDYPKDDMDWLHGKPIMYSFYKELEDFGLVRDRDFKIFGGGTGVNIVFDDKSVIKL